jgi:formylglycine-generating enzyme required for sulfatase activity
MGNPGTYDYSGDWSIDSRDTSRPPSGKTPRGPANPSSNRPQPANPNNGLSSAAKNAAQAPAPVYRHNESFEPEQVKSNNRLLVIVGGVVFALIVGLAVYYFVFYKSDTGNSVTGKDPKAWLEKMEMIAIPTGSYMMGRDPARDVAEDATPAHQVKVGGFMLSRHEITNKQYSDFLKATNHPSPSGWVGLQYPANQDDFPVSNISWDDAVSYCKWVSNQSGIQFRLPTEAEWEYAARGMDNRIYPWGQDWDPFKTVSSENSQSNVVAVSSAQLSSDRSPFGIIGMSGNLSEWTSSTYSLYPNSTAKEDPCTDCKIIRGGNFLSKDKNLLTTTNRIWQPNNFKNERVGFRIASDMPKE